MPCLQKNIRKVFSSVYDLHSGITVLKRLLRTGNVRVVTMFLGCLTPSHMISPSPGYSIIIEEMEENVSKSGLILHADGERGKGIIGTILEINQTSLCNECGGKRDRLPLKKGDRVIYSKFAAEQLELKDEEGKRIKNIRAVHCDSILAKYV